ncbi:exported protein of unknown function [Nitrospira japonica]|uniref:Uncharacterized protein n=1 Tax=Nitrospira japonica TaxID=1325564 RepID=A0A1W1I4T4_9BACT|nr:hypothetical protein [Nitrospira japonica]SLM48037.1 exported protein of unknown function [Nitrospira japonica]
MKIRIGVGMVILVLMALPAFAQVFPVDATSTTTITSVKADLIAWGVAFIGVALTVFAYKRVKALVH